MTKLIVERKDIPFGTITVSGAKNSATRVLAAALLSESEVILRNFPLELEDAKAKINFVSSMGAEVLQDGDKEELKICARDLSFSSVSDFELPIRTTYLLAGPALARHGHARIPYPGGCKIGSRGYDLHMMVWEKLGCVVEELPDYIDIRGTLVGANIDFPISTVGGTENALICASVAKGSTYIQNAYVTPEVRDLVAFLREMGARIDLEGGSHIRVQGMDGLLRGASFEIMSDRIEALTWLILGGVSGGRIMIRNVPFDTMKVPLTHLHDAGLDFFANRNSIMISPECIGPYGLQPFELATGTHPGVISDMQPFYVFLALFANGRSVIHDFRYPDRIAYTRELAKFAPGALDVKPGRITVHGNTKLQGSHVSSTDLRGSMAQILAAICADGCSQVDGVEMALRGYNRLPDKLRALGISGRWTE